MSSAGGLVFFDVDATERLRRPLLCRHGKQPSSYRDEVEYRADLSRSAVAACLCQCRRRYVNSASPSFVP